MFEQIKPIHAGTIINKQHKQFEPGHNINWERIPYIKIYQGERSILFIQMQRIRNPMTFC